MIRPIYEGLTSLTQCCPRPIQRLFNFERPSSGVLLTERSITPLCHSLEFAKHALSLVEKGHYIQEGDGFISSNFPHSPPYRLNEFKVLFANWSKQNSFEFNFFKKIASDNYAKGKLHMNCWEFVLLVMYEKKMITVEDIENLYLYEEKAKLERWVILWQPHTTQVAEVGDIALFCGYAIYHVAIVTSVNPLEITEIDHGGISTRSIESTDNLSFVNVHKAVEVIKNLERVDPKEHTQFCWTAEEFSILLGSNLLSSQVDQEMNCRYQLWRETEKKSAEQLLSEREVKRLSSFYKGVERDEALERALKSEYKENHKKEVEQFIIKRNGLNVG